MKIFNGDNTFLCLVFLLFLGTHLCGVYLFASGFFPKKEIFSGYSSLNDFPQTEGPPSVQVSAKYDRLVLMVVDAFRSDFLFGPHSEMKFVKSLMESGESRGFISRAHAPTVTLPRIKALVSGSLPSFADLILNFNSKELKEDNLVAQFKRAGKNITFYGDDTWINLFPDHFQRVEGVTSFYVSDYTEVDNNVTRNLFPEINKSDWSVLILHYLGLDHIGHLEGPYSNKMKPKIEEIDGILRQTYTALKQQDQEKDSRTLLVLCSDHGMNEVGNHGGTSEAETSAVLVFFSSTLEEKLVFEEVKEVAQVDLAPTLALLFGLPIPKNSMGTLIPDLFANLTAEEYLRALELNSLQRLQLMKASSAFWLNDGPTKAAQQTIELFEEAQQLHASWAATPQKHSHFASQAAELYLEFMHSLYEEFARVLTSYDEYSLLLGTILISISSLGFLLYVWAFVRQFVTQIPQIFGSPFLWLLFAISTSVSMLLHFQLYCPHSLSQLCQQHSSWFMYIVCVSRYSLNTIMAMTEKIFASGTFSLVVGTAIFGFSYRSVKTAGLPILLFLSFGCILHFVSLFASSLIEEEHQTWYFLCTTAFGVALLCSLYNQGNGSWGATLVVLICFRIMRSWNQTGVKWMDDLNNILLDFPLIYFGKWLNSPQILNRVIRFCMCGIACILPCIYAGRFADSEKMLIGKVTSAVFRNTINFCGISIFAYKFALFPTEYFPPVWMARFVYLCFGVAMFVALGYPFWKGKTRVPDDTIQHQQRLDDLIMTYAKVTPTLTLFAFTMLLLLLAKPHNMFVFVLLGAISHYLQPIMSKSGSFYTRILEVVIFTHWLGQAAFYGLGNSNSLATIDISGAYTGVSNYSEGLVGALIFLIGYSGPFFFYLSALVMIARMYYTENLVKETHSYANMTTTTLFVCFCLALLRSLQLFVFSIVTFIMRHHLFVWSVFSPKYVSVYLCQHMRSVTSKIYELLADCYLLFECLIAFFLIVHTILIGLLLDRRRKKTNKIV